MKTFLRYIASRCFSLLVALALVLAASGARAQAFSQPELEQMLAPVALYPDALLSQILEAATHPAELIEAAHWAETHPGLAGEEAVQAAEGERWDSSVRALVAFPQVLAQMRENLQWAQALGDAFVVQQVDVLDTVQRLRRRAQAAGNLRPDDRIRVIESGTDLLLQPFDPQAVYVPYYDPLLVYGAWWWPNQPPVYLRPPPRYNARPAYAGLVYRMPPVIVPARIFVRAIEWRHTAAGRPAHADSSLTKRPADARRNPLFRTPLPSERHTAQAHELPPPRPVNVNRSEAGARRETPREAQSPKAIPRVAGVHPAETAARERPSARPVARHEPAAPRIQQVRPPRAEIRHPEPAVGQQPGARTESRWKMRP